MGLGGADRLGEILKSSHGGGKVKKEPRKQEITNFSFKMFKMMRFLRSSKCSKTIIKLTFTTQKANTCSPWTTCSVFDWKYPFWVNFQKLNIVSFKLKFRT